MVGEQIAHYEILRELGAGGMGQVYLARDARLDREVALKILPMDLAADPERLARFEREAKALASLSHPNIVTIYSVEEADGVPFMTMELVDGQTLDRLIPEEGMPLGRFLEIAVPLADAVAAAHDRGIQHRDLKPANVMVTGDGRVKVLDFGLAKHRRQGAAPEAATQLVTGDFTGDLTGEGKIVGTVAYMSPEQAQGTLVDHRSDIFSLGILMYEMVTGRRPFGGPNNISVLSAILKDDPESVSDVRDAVPAPLARIIQRTLAKRPDQRYQSARDMKQDLADLQRDLQAEDLISSGLYSGTHDRAKAGETNRLLRAGLLFGALALAVATALAFLVWSGGRSDVPAPPVPPDLTAMPARAEMPALAVLPFDNISDDEELDWLGAGLAEMLTTDLSQAPGLRVLGTDRVHDILSEAGHMADRNSADAARDMGRMGGVSRVVRGSFVRAGEQLRIDARVEAADSGEVLGSERVSGSPDDVFALVDELSRRISERVGMRGMSAAGRSAMEAAGMGDRDITEVTTGSVEAYRLYAEGMRRLHDSREDEAIPLLQRAAELDPDFAMAWAKLSVALGNEGRLAEAREAATRAFELSESLPPEERYYIQGRYWSLTPESIDEAIAAYTRVLELFPDNTAARNNLAAQLMSLERFEEAIPHFEELVELETRFSGTYNNLANAYAGVGRLDEAVGILRDYVARHPENVDARLNLAAYLAHAGRLDEAEREVRTAIDLEDRPANRNLLASLHALRDEWDAFDDQVEIMADAGPGTLAHAHAAWHRGNRAVRFGDPDEAFRVFAAARAAMPEDSPWQSMLLDSELRIAWSVRDPGRIDRLADELERVSPNPGAAQNVAVSRMLAATMRGDSGAARAQRAEFDRILEGIATPDRLEERVDAQIDGMMAWASGDAEAGVASMERAYRLLTSKHIGVDAFNMCFILGELHWEAGNHSEGAAWIERAGDLRLARYDAPVEDIRSHWYLGTAAAEAGDREAALEHYRRFLFYWGEGEIDRPRVEQARQYVQEHG